VPARDCEPHHTDQWVHSHRTPVDAIGSLCLFHHQRLHEGAFEMIRVGPGKFRFETAWGLPIPPVPGPVNPLTGGVAHLQQRAADHGTVIDWETPRARSGGEAFDFRHAVDTLVGNTLLGRAQEGARAAPGP
jgi:hypothetical protein